jgi:exonuclease SbcD
VRGRFRARTIRSGLRRRPGRGRPGILAPVPKVLHTADWHLGKRLKRFDLANEQREALERLLAVIDAEQPDVVVVAGDVFDVPERQPLSAIRTWTWITQEITRRAPIVAIPGNHDHAERIGYNTHLTRASGLYILNDLERAHEGLVLAGLELFGLPFHKPARVRALLERDASAGAAPVELDDFDYDTAMRHLVDRTLGTSRGTHPRVAIAHAFVAGSGEEDSSEDPIMVGGAGRRARRHARRLRLRRVGPPPRPPCREPAPARALRRQPLPVRVRRAAREERHHRQLGRWRDRRHPAGGAYRAHRGAAQGTRRRGQALRGAAARGRGAAGRR